MNTGEYRSALDIVDLMGKLKRLLLVQRRADCLICRYLADLADGMGKWPGLIMIYGDVGQLVRARLGLTLRSTRERIRVGRALRTLPALDAALASGRLTYSRIREVTRVAKPENEWFWLEAAQRLSMRALERRVGQAGKHVQPRVRESETRGAADRVKLSVPHDVWLLLKQAMHVVSAAAGRKLEEVEALAAVARGALAYHNASVAAEALGTRVASGDSPHATHSGTGTDGSAVEGATHSGAGTDGSAAEGVMHTGAGGGASAGGRLLSHDERLIMEAMGTGRHWSAAALCEVTGLSVSRLAYALDELRLSGLIVRESLGLFDEFRLATGGRGFKQAG